MPEILRAVLLAGLPLAAAAVFGATDSARAQDGYPYSIMREEPGTPRPKPKPKAEPQQKEPQKKADTAKRKPRARGSSTASTIPTYRSTVTPLGTAPKIIETPPMGRAASPGMVVPGVTGLGGTPAVTPPRPAGQGFQDRARNCFAAGSATVGPGQIGTYARSCVNQ